MSDLLQEYKDYYRVRKEQYENNPNYKNTFETENAMFEAMNSCNELIEFKNKLGNLNEQNAVNLTKDQYIMRKKHYDELNEPVRVLASNRILEKSENIHSAQEIITVVGEEENKNSIEISMDESVRMFYTDSWTYLDNIDIYSNAKVPSKYQADMDKSRDKAIQNLKEEKEYIENNNQKWDPNWKYDPDQIQSFHHKRLVPYPDESLNEKLNEYKKYI